MDDDEANYNEKLRKWQSKSWTRKTSRMASKIVGSIVATDIATGLKTVLHVHKDGGKVNFTKPDSQGWSHLCHASNEKNANGWCHEVNTLSAPTFKDAEYFPV